MASLSLDSAVGSKAYTSKTAKLEEVASLIRAPLFKSESAGRKPVYVASVLDFPRCGYLGRPGRTAMLNKHAEEANRFLIRPFDVLLTIVGTIGKLSVAPHQIGEPWIPATNIVILRLWAPSLERALALYLYLRSEKGQSGVGNLIHGKTIPLVSKKALGKVPIPVITESMARRAKEIFLEELSVFEQYRAAQARIDSRIAVFPE